MRISTFQQANWNKNELGKVQTKVSYHQQQVSSGKKHINMSEEPLAASKTLALKHSIRAMEEQQNDITDATSVLSTTESALTGIQKVLDRVNTLTTQALNGTNSQDDLNATAIEIEELVKQVVSLGNTKHNGNYIFAGDKPDQKPFADDGTFQGGSGDVSWDISGSYSVKVYESGEEPLSSTISTLHDMITQLKAGDTEGLKQSLETHQNNTNHVINLISTVGAKESTLQSLTDIISEQTLALEEQRSTLEDVDMVEAVSDLSNMNTTYQAMLQAVSMTNKVSILNYM